MPPPFVCILLTVDIGSIPWNVRKDQRVIQLQEPTPYHMLEWINKQETGHTDEDKQRLVNESRSWRQLQYNLSMTPVGRAPPTSTDIIIKLPDVEQPMAILGGEQKGPSSVNVLRVIEAAEYNHADAEEVRLAQWMESRTWHAAGLAKVSRAYAEQLRSKYTDVQKTPYRKRRFTSKTR